MRYRFAPQGHHQSADEADDLPRGQSVGEGRRGREDERRAKLAACQGRPSSSEPEKTSVMSRDEVLARAPYPTERFEPMPVAGMSIGD